MMLVVPMKAWKACVSTGPTSVRERLLPESLVTSGVTPSAANCGCGLSTSREGMTQPLSAGTGPPASTMTVAPVAFNRV